MELGVDLDDFDDAEEEEKTMPYDSVDPIMYLINDPELKAKFKYIFSQMSLGYLDRYEMWQVTNLVMIALEILKMQEYYHRLADIIEKKLEEYKDPKMREKIEKKIEKYKKVDLRPLVELILSPAISVLKVSGSKGGFYPKLMHTSIKRVEQAMIEEQNETKKRIKLPWGGGGNEW